MSSGLSSAARPNWVDRGSDLILPLAMIASVLVILVPLPPALLDVLLAGNITIAVLILLTTIYVRAPLDFSIFPSLLLATTLARLVLNVASTRLILTRAGTDGLDAAGSVITAFSDFVAGDKVVVGVVIFVIIIVIQFVVITKGATRISEVAARFALDGMPGKQMAIDADLNAGIIDEKEAQRRRGEITQQADFYGAMDGASKFVRGDAIAGIVITIINIVGGFTIGVAEYGMSFGDAASTFTRLTIGDGLVSQIPAFLISLAAGLLVTRSTQRSNMPQEFIGQLFSRPQALAVTGGFLAVLMFTSLPRVPLMLLGAACLSGAIANADTTSCRARTVGAGRSTEAAIATGGRARRGFSGRRPDGDRARSWIDPAGRSQARRRLIGSRPASEAERRSGNRCDHAESPHSRQHAARAESVSHQNCRHSGGAR
jgi:flagellar biosynthesis protein FlhA